MSSILPISTRIFSQTIGIDLVSVQPLSGPSGNLFYMDDTERLRLIEEARKKRRESVLKILK